MLDIPSDVFDKLHLNGQIYDVDRFILDEIASRDWTDTPQSYNDILLELRHTLNIHTNQDPYKQIEKLARGIELVKLQRMHERRSKEIQSALEKL